MGYAPEELVLPPLGSWDLVASASGAYVAGTSGADSGGASPIAAGLPIIYGPPVIPGLDPAEIAQALQNGLSIEDLEAFSRVAATVPPASRPPLLGSRSQANLGRQWPPPPKNMGAPSRSGRPPTQTRPPDRSLDISGAPVHQDFFTQLTVALQQGLRPSPSGVSPLDRALAGLGGGSLDADGSGSLQRQGRARLLLCQALEDDPGQFTSWVDRALADAFPSRPAPSRPTMREYVEHRSRFSSSHRPSMLTAWAVAGARDALRNGHTAQALARLDVLMVSLEQIAIDQGSLLMAQELLWEPEPPTIAYSASSAETAWRKPCSGLCAPAWAEVGFARLRDLDDWALRKQRLTSMGPKGKGRGKAKANDTAAPGGWVEHDAPAVIKNPGARGPKGRGTPLDESLGGVVTRSGLCPDCVSRCGYESAG